MSWHIGFKLIQQTNNKILKSSDKSQHSSYILYPILLIQRQRNQFQLLSSRYFIYHPHNYRYIRDFWLMRLILAIIAEKAVLWGKSSRRVSSVPHWAHPKVWSYEGTHRPQRQDPRKSNLIHSQHIVMNAHLALSCQPQKPLGVLPHWVLKV